MNRARCQTILFPLVVIILSILIYSNTFHNDFVYDDFRGVVDNALVRSFSFSKCLQVYSKQPGQTSPPARVIPLITYAVNYAIHGLKPYGYHLVNVLLHGLISLLIYGIGLQLFPGRPLLAFITAALFAVNPIHTDVVDPVSGRSELLAAFCLLLSLWIYLKKTPRVDSGRGFGYWLTLPIFLIGALSKATAWALPLLLIGCDFYRFKPSAPKSLSRYFPVFTRRLRIFYLPYLLLPVIIFGIIIIAGYTPADTDGTANFLRHLPFGARITAALGIFARYLVLLVFPVRLSCDYGFAHLSSPTKLVNALWAAGGVIAVLGGLWLAISSIKKKGRYFMAIFIFAATYFIVSNLILVINTPMAERLIYLPSWGFCLLLGLILEDIFIPDRDGKILRSRLIALWLVLITVLALYSLRTWTRNRDWKDQSSLMYSASRVCSNSARVQYNLGLAYEERGELDKAVFHYQRAVAIIPLHPNFHLGLGNVYGKQGLRELRAAEYREAIRVAPEKVDGYYNLGMVYAEMMIWQKSVEAFRRAGEINPGDPRIFNKLGISCYRAGKEAEAIKAFRQALIVNPDFRDARINLERVMSVENKDSLRPRLKRRRRPE